MLIFFPHLLTEYTDVFSSCVPQSPVIQASPNGREIIQLLFRISPTDIRILKGFLVALFGVLLQDMTFREIEKYNISTLKSILLFCAEHFSEPIKVSDVANSLHISRYHIAHIFRKKLNTTYNEYITGKRIEYAATLLSSESLSIIDIAYKSGFNSIRTFNRNFVKYFGISPKEYKQQKRDKA